MMEIEKYISLGQNQRWKIKDNNNLTMIFYIDFKGAYNSINRKKLFQRMIQDFPEYKKELQFLEWIYMGQIAGMNNILYHPRQGVPQGGINPPLLSNFAPYYLLGGPKQKINLQVPDINKMHLPGPPKPQEYQHAYIDEQNCIAYADDLLFIINMTKKPYYLKKYLQCFFQTLIKTSEKWGLNINF